MLNRTREYRLNRLIEEAKQKASRIQALMIITEDPAELQKLQVALQKANATLEALCSPR